MKRGRPFSTIIPKVIVCKVALNVIPKIKFKKTVFHSKISSRGIDIASKEIIVLTVLTRM